VRALNIADVAIVGEGAEAILAAHARRDVERWSELDTRRLAEALARGWLCVVVSRAPAIEELQALDRGVELLWPAP
jgi:hypothetical protein